MDDIYKLGLTKWHPEIKLKNWTRKKDCIKVKKKIRNNWIWYSYSSSKLLKINQKKTEIMGIEIFINQVKKKLISSLYSIIIKYKLNQ
jgi:hypothetical protein